MAIGRKYPKKPLTSLKVFKNGNRIELLVKDPAKRTTLKEVLQHQWVTQDAKGVREARRNSLPGDAFTLYSMVKPDTTNLLKDVQKKKLKE